MLQAITQTQIKPPNILLYTNMILYMFALKTFCYSFSFFFFLFFLFELKLKLKEKGGNGKGAMELKTFPYLDMEKHIDKIDRQL